MSVEPVEREVGALRSVRSAVVSVRVAYALSIATGVLYFLGFPGADVWPCALVAFVPLIVALEGQSPSIAFRLGWVAGLVMNVLGIFWLHGTIRKFSELPGVVCALLTLTLCCYQAARVGLMGWLWARARQRGWPRIPSLIGAFIASELVFPLIFPWYFGASAHRVPALMQWAELGGPCLVGLVLLAPSIALSNIVIARRRRDRVRRDAVLAGLAVPVGAALIGLVQMWHVDRRVARAPAVHVGLAQANLEPPAIGKSVERINRELRLTEQLRRKGVDVVVWSEGVVLGVPEAHQDAYLQTLFTGRLRVPTLVGALLLRGEKREQRVLNSAIATRADGSIAGRYDKHRLFPVGEWFPLFDTFPELYSRFPNLWHFARGTSLAPVSLGGHPVTVLICYEDVFPSFVNEAVAAGKPEMLVNLTNDAWFGDTSEPWMHLALAQFRAVEHRRYLVRATNSGVSAIIDPAGRIVVQGGTFREEALDGTAHWMSGMRTAYEVWGDGPWWLLTAATGVMAFRRRRAV